MVVSRCILAALALTWPWLARAEETGVNGIKNWQLLGGAWQIVSNVLECVQETPGWGKTLLLGGPVWQDGEVSARILNLPREGGLIVRCRDSERWIGVLFYAGEMNINEMRPEGVRHLQRVRKAYRENTPFVVKVRLTGRELHVCLDGEEVALTELTWEGRGRMGFFSYGGGLKVSDVVIEGEGAEDARVEPKPFQAWDAAFVERTIRADMTATERGVRVTGQATLSSQVEVTEAPTRLRWSLRSWVDGAVVAEAESPLGPLRPLAREQVTGTLAADALTPGLYLLVAELEAGKQRGLPWGTQVRFRTPEPDPDALKWSAKTADWRFPFDGTRAGIAELARRYADYYEPRMLQLVMANSRELDTALGAYAALYAQSKDKVWSGKYRRLAIDLALQRGVLAGFWGDPTVQNDLLPSYRFMREQGVFTALEREWMEGWIAWLLTQMSFPMQHANHGRLAMAALALKGTRHEGRAEALLQGAGEPFRTSALGGNDAFAYDRIDWKHQMLWAETVDPRALTREPFREVSRAYFSLWTPTGIQPGYGDDTGSSFWDPILPEWMAAHHLRNGQYKAIAIRAMQFALDHDQLRELGAQPALFTLWSRADDTLQPTPPTLPGTLVPFVPPPDKLVIRGGWEPDDPYLLFDLWGGKGHNHADQGALIWLVWMSRVWMADSNYDIRETPRHNLLCLEGREAVNRVTEILPGSTVTNAESTVSSCGFVSTDYGMPGVRWTRQVDHGVPRSGGPAGHWFRVADTVATDVPAPPPARILWHIRGVPRQVSDREWRFTQDGMTLEIRVTGGTGAVEPYEEPKQLQIGTGCPPDAYRLCWGEPYSLLTLTPEKRIGQGAEWLRVTTEFRVSK